MPTRLRPWFTTLLTALSLLSLMIVLTGSIMLSVWGYARYGLLPGPLNGVTLYPLWLQPSLVLLTALVVFIHLCWLQRLQGSVLPQSIAYLAGPGPNPLPALALMAVICLVPWWVVIGFVAVVSGISYLDKNIPRAWACIVKLFIRPVANCPA